MSETPVEILRAAFAQSVITTLAIQVMAYMRLISHPEVQFEDLLSALDRGPVIADDAARKLHRRLAIPVDTPVTQRAYWEQMLQQHQISPTDLFHTVSLNPAPVPSATPTP